MPKRKTTSSNKPAHATDVQILKVIANNRRGMDGLP
jgi:hypothetical protein